MSSLIYIECRHMVCDIFRKDFLPGLFIKKFFYGDSRRLRPVERTGPALHFLNNSGQDQAGEEILGAIGYTGSES